MAEQSLTVYLRAEDEASGKVRSIGQSITRELENMQRATFASSHSAHELQMRDLDDHFAKVEAKYKAIGESLRKGEVAILEKQFTAWQAGETGKKTKLDPAELEKELNRNLALQARAEDVRIEATRAAAAMRTQLETKEQARGEEALRLVMQERATAATKISDNIFRATHTGRQVELYDARLHYRRLIEEARQYGYETAGLVEAQRSREQQINEKWNRQAARDDQLGGRWGRIAGRLLQFGGAYIGTQAAGRGVEAAEASGELARARAGGDVQGQIAAQIKLNDAVAGFGQIIPFVGSGIERLIKSTQDTPRLQRLAEEFKKIDDASAGLAKQLESLADSITKARIAAFGITPSEALRSENVARASQMKRDEAAAEKSLMEAREAVASAKAQRDAAGKAGWYDTLRRNPQWSWLPGPRPEERAGAQQGLVSGAEQNLQIARKRVDALKQAQADEQALRETEERITSQREEQARQNALARRVIELRMPESAPTTREERMAMQTGGPEEKARVTSAVAERNLAARQAREKAFLEQEQKEKLQEHFIGLGEAAQDVADARAWKKRQSNALFAARLTKDMTLREQDDLRRATELDAEKNYKIALDGVTKRHAAMMREQKLQGEERGALEKGQLQERAQQAEASALRRDAARKEQIENELAEQKRTKDIKQDIRSKEVGWEEMILRKSGQTRAADELAIRERYKKEREEYRGKDTKLLAAAEQAELAGLKSKASALQGLEAIQVRATRFIQTPTADPAVEQLTVTKEMRAYLEVIAKKEGLTLTRVESFGLN